MTQNDKGSKVKIRMGWELTISERGRDLEFLFKPCTTWVSSCLDKRNTLVYKKKKNNRKVGRECCFSFVNGFIAVCKRNIVFVFSGCHFIHQTTETVKFCKSLFAVLKRDFVTDMRYAVSQANIFSSSMMFAKKDLSSWIWCLLVPLRRRENIFHVFRGKMMIVHEHDGFPSLPFTCSGWGDHDNCRLVLLQDMEVH